MLKIIEARPVLSVWGCWCKVWGLGRVWVRVEGADKTLGFGWGQVLHGVLSTTWP